MCWEYCFLHKVCFVSLIHKRFFKIFFLFTPSHFSLLFPLDFPCASFFVSFRWSHGQTFCVLICHAVTHVSSHLVFISTLWGVIVIILFYTRGSWCLRVKQCGESCQYPVPCCQCNGHWLASHRQGLYMFLWPQKRPAVLGNMPIPHSNTPHPWQPLTDDWWSWCINITASLLLRWEGTEGHFLGWFQRFLVGLCSNGP